MRIRAFLGAVTVLAGVALPVPALAEGAGTVAGLRAQVTRHIANARELASRAAQRAQWAEQRQAALNRVYQHIVSAGGTGLAINGNQVVARRSLAELASAINAVRGSADTAAVMRSCSEMESSTVRLRGPELPMQVVQP